MTKTAALLTLAATALASLPAQAQPLRVFVSGQGLRGRRSRRGILSARHGAGKRRGASAIAAAYSPPVIRSHGEPSSAALGTRF
jgi:hypothetical protein